VGDEEVEFRLADQFLNVVEEVESLGSVRMWVASVLTPGNGYSNLFIRNSAECVIGIFAFEINHEFGKLVVLSQSVYGIN
jgi:hypothetical protein